MTCLCTGRPPCWVCEDGQDHHQTHGNGPVSAEGREMDHGDDDGATGAERGEG